MFVFVGHQSKPMNLLRWAADWVSSVPAAATGVLNEFEGWETCLKEEDWIFWIRKTRKEMVIQQQQQPQKRAFLDQ